MILFFIDDAISISEETLKTSSHGLNIKLLKEENLSLVLQGNYLSSVVDIFYIVFENIIRHSKLKTRPNVEISLKHIGNTAYLTIENEIGDQVEVEQSNERIEAIKAAMKEGKYMKSISKEGGTGFHKILKILSHEFSSPVTELDFGFKENVMVKKNKRQNSLLFLHF